MGAINDPQSRPVVITIFTRVVRPSVHPHLSKSRKVQARLEISTGGNVGRAEWIIDVTHVLYNDLFDWKCYELQL